MPRTKPEEARGAGNTRRTHHCSLRSDDDQNQIAM